MKKLLVLSMMLVLGFSSAVSFAEEEENPHRVNATTEEPNENNSRTVSKGGTQAGANAIGTADDCPECRARTKQGLLGEDTNFRKGSTIDFKQSGQKGAQ